MKGWKGALGFAAFVLLVVGATYAVRYAPSHASTAPLAPSGVETASGQPLRVECSSVDGGVVPLDATTLLPAPDGQPVRYQWWDGARFLGGAARMNATLGLGLHNVTLVRSDATGATTNATRSYLVEDTVAPTIHVVPNLQHVSPADGRFVPITVAVDVRDACDGDASWTLVAVAGGGDGSVRDADLGTADNAMELRADLGTYTLTYKAVDASGNVAQAGAVVTVTN
jgi:hypothetical protein